MFATLSAIHVWYPELRTYFPRKTEQNYPAQRPLLNTTVGWRELSRLDNMAVNTTNTTIIITIIIVLSIIR